MLRLATGEVWKESLAKVGLSLEELRALAAANPTVIANESRLARGARRRWNANVFSGVHRQNPITARGNTAAAEHTVQALFKDFEPVPSPLHGINLDILLWFRDLDEGMKDAVSKNRPALLFFDASWCLPIPSPPRRSFRAPRLSRRLKAPSPSSCSTCRTEQKPATESKRDSMPGAACSAHARSSRDRASALCFDEADFRGPSRISLVGQALNSNRTSRAVSSLDVDFAVEFDLRRASTEMVRPWILCIG